MLVIGHRGASADAPENSPEAFRLADEQGADGVELDVRLAPRGRLVVRHDPLPDDLTADRSAGLSTVLDACGDRMLVNVEIKNLASDGGFDPTMTVVRLTLDELRRRGPAAHDRWLISSFSWATIQACHSLAPEIATAFLCTTLDAVAIARIAATGHQAVHPLERIVDDSLVDRCHDAGLIVNTWTCNAPDRIIELNRIGVDAVCTDVPAVALEAMGRAAVRSPVQDRASWGTRA